MRELRAALDDLARETGRPRVTVSAIVMGRHADNTFYGMDTRAWAEEGIVDTLIPFSEAHRMNSAATSFPDPTDDDVRGWADLARRTGVTVALNLLPRWVPPSVYRERALGLYRAGIEHLFFWDAYSRANTYDQLTWNAIRRLGHRDELEAWSKKPRPAFDTTWVRGEDEEEVNAWVAAGEPPLGPTSVELTRLGGWDLATGTPG